MTAKQLLYIITAMTNEQQFEKYKKLLLEWNKKFNLTAIIESEQIDIKHFKDSLSFAEATKAAGFDINTSLDVADVGSGAGFPGIPLKIAYPNLKMTLIESLGKKCKFLEEVVKQLDLKNVVVLNKRAETVCRGEACLTRPFDIVLARAVSSLENLTLWCLPLLKENGVLITQKGLKELDLIKDFADKNQNLEITTKNYQEKVFVIIRI